MEVLVSKGFIVLAQNTDSVNYVKQAYALALSIKSSQVENSISLVTNNTVPKKYREVFDNIIPIPWYENTTTSSRFCAEHRWKLYHASPYEETIVLDTDMLMLEDISEWWKYCNNYNLKFCSRVKNYKLDTVVDTVHRKAFVENKLSNPYYALHYFKKSQEAHDFYKVLEFVINNWEWCWGVYTPLARQEWVSMDLAIAVAIEITGCYNSVFDRCCPLEFIHMKTPLQGWPLSLASWQAGTHYVLNSRGELIVGNIRQSKLFHYIENDFLSKQIIEQLEELSNGKKTTSK